MEKLYQKTGGFIKGICHPGEHISLLQEAGIRWVRMDTPYPYDGDDLSEAYREYCARCRSLSARGLGVISISPFPNAFFAAGIDLTAQEGLQKAEDLCEFIARDLSDIRICWQAANEQFIPHFRMPLNVEQSSDFLAASIRGLKKGNPRAAVGHNSVDREMQYPLERVEEKCGGSDYIGLDLYDGTWTEGGPESYLTAIDTLHARIQRPVILMEFGFASAGEGCGDIYAEGYKWLGEKGFHSVEDAIARLDELMPHMPPACEHVVNECAPEDRLQCLISFVPHAMKVWPASAPIPHTEAGQAEFYDDLLPRLMHNPHLGGAVIYCMQDSPICFCGQKDCPLETAWGLLRCDGSKKPAFDVVKRHLT